MTNLKRPSKPVAYVFTFLGASLIWFVGAILGGAIIKAVNLVENSEALFVAWAIILALALIAAAWTIGYHIYEDRSW